MVNFFIPIIKYSFLFLNCTYALRKMLQNNQRVTKMQFVYMTSSAVFVALSAYLCHQLKIPYTVVFVCESVFVYALLFRKDFDIIVVSTVLGYGICYFFFAVATFFVTCIHFLFKWSPENSAVLEIFLALAIGVIQSVLLFLLFRIRRLKNGFSFLSNPAYRDTGLILSCFILAVVVFLSTEPTNSSYIAILFCAILGGSLALWFWWRNKLKKVYLESLQKRYVQELENKISSLENETAQITADNERLSQIVHRDNKIIPAMELAVKELLYLSEKQAVPEISTKAHKLIAQLERTAMGRSGIVDAYAIQKRDLPVTGVAVIDALLTYMQCKALAAEISFDTIIHGNIMEMIDSTVSEQDMATVLADLIENAIIATECTPEEKHILVDIGFKGKAYSICVFDSAPPFPKEVLDAWGKQRITTHADSGGSGIGMMSTYDICERYHASFYIKKAAPESIYTKSVEIRFDCEERFSAAF